MRALRNQAVEPLGQTNVDLWPERTGVKMTHIYACFKWVVDEADIRIEGTAADFSRARWKISDYDLNAIEAACQTKANQADSEVVGLTIGGASAKASLKDALSRGLDSVWHIHTGATGVDDHRISSKALAALLKKLLGEHDTDALVLCAEGSQDLFGRQTAPRIAATLGWPVVTSVSEFTIHGTSLKATRKLEDCIESIRVELPVVISVLPSINSPDYPRLKAIMAASKKPMNEIALSELGIPAPMNEIMVSDEGYVTNRKGIVFDEGTTEEKVAQLLESLKKEGVL